MVISFLGVRTDGQTDGQTDRHGFGILIWKHVGTQKISTQSSKLVVSRRFLYASPEVGDAQFILTQSYSDEKIFLATSVSTDISNFTAFFFTFFFKFI